MSNLNDPQNPFITLYTPSGSTWANAPCPLERALELVIDIYSAWANAPCPLERALELVIDIYTFFHENNHICSQYV